MVVDRARFPSFTSSTHFFRGDGLVRAMDAVGVLDDVLAFGSPPLTCEYDYEDGSPTPVQAPPQDPGDVGYCLSVRREPLDATLLGHAARLGAHVETSTAVVETIVEGGRAVGVALAGGRTVRAGLVVGADGLRSAVANSVGAPDRERQDGKRALYYRYVDAMPGPNGPPDGPEFSRIGDELAYVFPSDRGVTCVAISVNVREYERMRHGASARFEELLRRHEGLWPRYSQAQKSSRLLGSGPQPDFVRQPAGPGWALVGDSTIHQDPWSGVGMDSAGVSALILADCILAAGGAGDGGEFAAAYEQARDERVLGWYHDTVAGAADLSVI
jgi:flavin-dependent dehydrogenase